MTINNIALVRATNVIPMDGIIKPISNVPYLCKKTGNEFSSKMNDLLRRLQIIPTIDPSRLMEEGYYDEMAAFTSKILKEYLPYTSDYNSMVLFSLNGLCPDDNEHGFANNTFSNKKCAIIEPLIHHISEVISLVPTDTAIKGNVTLSKDAIILIEEETFQTLREKEKIMLSNLDLTVKTFKGSLKEAIETELKNSGRYLPEQLSLSASTGGFYPSETSEMQKKYIHTIRVQYGLSGQKYFNLITEADTNYEKYEKVKGELDKAWKVQEYYLTTFLKTLLTIMQSPDDMIEIVEFHLYNPEFMKKIIDFIQVFGIENYKQFVDDYNQELENRRNLGTLPTPEEIVNGNNTLDYRMNVK